MTEDKFELKDHQLYAVEMMNSNTNLGVFYGCGCGKTALSLAWLVGAYRRGDINSALVVCPATVVDKWYAEMDSMSRFAGYTEEDVMMLKEKTLVTSYQKTYKVLKRPIHHRDGQVTYKRELHLRDEVDKVWGALIVDESHRAGAHDSIQSKSCMKLATNALHRYILSGTPVHGGKGQEDFGKLYSQFKILDPNMWRSWSQFCSEYVISYDRWGKPYRYNIPKCRALMQDHAIVARLEECFDMPEKTETVMDCKLAEKKMYKDILEGDILQYGIDIENAGGQYIKLLQICSGSMKRDEDTMALKTSKDDILADLIDDSDDSLVIFCRYTASIDRVEAICKKHGKKVMTFDGRTADKGSWIQFQNGKFDVIICQYGSGGEGLDLFRSHTLIYFEPCLSALQLEQSAARIMRKGQVNHCRYLYLSTPHTIEEKVWNTVRAGKDVSDDMLLRWARGEIFDAE